MPFERVLVWYERRVRTLLQRPGRVLAAVAVIFCASLMMVPLLGVAFFPRTDAGQFVVNVKSPSGTRIEISAADVRRVEEAIRDIVDPHELDLIRSDHRGIPGV